MKILFETIFGSHIYGTNTPSSDLDYKGVFLAEPKDIIFGNKNHSIVITTKSHSIEGVRNSKDDVDKEFKELRRFINDALDGQTYAIDMLYAPRNLWQSTSPEWEYLIANREKFLSKNVNAFIGYCNQQASKYGLKGTRLGTLLEVIDYLQIFPSLEKLGNIPAIKTGEFVKYVTYKHKVATNLKDETMLEIMGKKYSNNMTIKNVLESLTKFSERYGSRAKVAQENDGIDWKAISHAYRCCYQLSSLATLHRVDFPLPEADYLKQIKTGQISYPDIIQNELPLLMEKSIALVKQSTLPDKPDEEFWNEYVLKTYLQYLKHETSNYL